MPGTRAQKQQKEEKIHGDALETAVSSAGEHDATERNPAIPAPDDGSHARSQAAHLGGHVHDHTKPVGDLRRYELEREPPQEVTRAGKDYRRQ
jgi:hypothetical protein